ncbi:MAG: serine/threonine protein kinase, partial [Pseudomonadota bacterium]
DAEIVVAGTLSSRARRDELRATLQSLAGGRLISMRTDLLNTGLCRIDQSLPNVPASGIEIIFRYGGKDERNETDTYFVGENPVIDLVLPAQIRDGHLWVSIVDVTGNVYHLLPNVNRPNNTIAALRNGATGPVSVRVTYPVEDALTPDKLAFIVDDSALGTGKLVAFLSSGPIFAADRPSAEPVEEFAALLADLPGDASIISLDSRLLITERP